MGVGTKSSQKEVGGPESKKGGEKPGEPEEPEVLVLETTLAHLPLHQLSLAQVLAGILAVSSQADIARPGSQC